jgi:hypothetical protein
MHIALFHVIQSRQMSSVLLQSNSEADTAGQQDNAGQLS